MFEFFPDLSARHRQPEVMDRPGLRPARHGGALKGLARINTLSLAGPRVWREIRRLHSRSAGCIRVLDVACGGGDVAIAIKSRSERVGIPMEVHGCDRNPVAVEFARARAVEQAVEVNFFRLDVLERDLPSGFDLVCSSLFLHHLSDSEALLLLVKLGKAGKRILVQDLLRTRIGYLMATAAVRVLTRSPVVRIDGPRSVRSAFTLLEVRALAERARLKNPCLSRCWPERFSLSWESAR